MFREQNVATYERFEFLGDAVIESMTLYVARKILLKLGAYIYPELLHGIKALILSTNGLASMFVYHKLHRFLRFKDIQDKSPDEVQKIQNYIRQKNFELRCKQWTWEESASAPKYLADTMEAICGAIFIDGGWEALISVFLRMAAPLIFFMCKHFDDVVVDLSHDIIAFFDKQRTLG